MLTKSYIYLFFPPKLKRLYFRYEQNHLDTKQSFQVRMSSWCLLLSMWRNRNYGTFTLLLRTLFRKIWDLAGKTLTLALSHHSGEYIPAEVLTPLEIVFNKPHPSILLHIFFFSDATTRKVLILLLQEIKRDIVYRRAHLQEPRRHEELHPRIQAHLVSVINKISSLLEYQGTLQFVDGLSFLQRLSWIILQAWNSSSYLVIPPIIPHTSHSLSIPLAVLTWCKTKKNKKKINC